MWKLEVSGGNIVSFSRILLDFQVLLYKGSTFLFGKNQELSVLTEFFVKLYNEFKFYDC